MIFKFDDFLLEKLINESIVVYSDNLRDLLSEIESPISTALLDGESKDYSVSNNYFDIGDKDTISFVSDKKAQDLIGDDPKFAIYGGGSLLTNNIEANKDIFDLLDYKPEGDKPYHPQVGERGKIVARATSPTTLKKFVKLKFSDGECVINQDKLKPEYALQDIWSKNRQNIRTGRGVRALLKSLKHDFKESDIEEFVNKYKAAIDKKNDIFKLFELVSGDDIAHWYSSDNYLRPGHGNGTLGNSCMANASSYYFEIYTKNPDVCQLLILKSEEDETKIKARALVWKLEEPYIDDKNITFLDRVYTLNDSDVELYRDYAKSKNWVSKYSMDSSPDAKVILPNGEVTTYSEMKVTIRDLSYNGYPYVDTLKYYDEYNNTLSTDDSGNCLTLEDTGGGHSGSCDYCGGEGRVDCGYCDGTGDEECNNCSGRGQIRCDDCSGEGTLECGSCEGSGEVACKECHGVGNIDIDCPDCGGTGEIGEDECENCGGSGQILEDCEACDGDGKTQCEECKGDGNVKCPECDGDGENECSSCEGRGEHECHNCDGDGRVDCPECY